LLLVEDGDVADDDPLLLEALHPVADRADAHAKLAGDVPEALPRIRVQPPEDRDVELIEKLHDHGGRERVRVTYPFPGAPERRARRRSSVRVLALCEETELVDPLVDWRVGRLDSRQPIPRKRIH